MNDPNWHRLPKERDPLAHCVCGHQLQDHDPTDLAPCGACDCEEYQENTSWEPGDEPWEPNDRDEWGRIR